MCLSVHSNILNDRFMYSIRTLSGLNADLLGIRPSVVSNLWLPGYCGIRSLTTSDPQVADHRVNCGLVIPNTI